MTRKGCYARYTKEISLESGLQEHFRFENGEKKKQCWAKVDNDEGRDYQVAGRVQGSELD